MDHKTPLDCVSLSMLVSVFLGALPHLAALMSLIWGMIRIYETKTFQAYLIARAERKARYIQSWKDFFARFKQLKKEMKDDSELR